MHILYEFGKWRITAEDLVSRNAPNPSGEELAKWCYAIANGIGTGEGEIDTLTKAVDQVDNVILAALTIHTVGCLKEGLSLADGLASFDPFVHSGLVNMVKAGLAAQRLDNSLRTTAKMMLNELEVPRGSPISNSFDFVLFYAIKVIFDAGHPILKPLKLIRDEFSRSGRGWEGLCWQATQMYQLISGQGYNLSQALQAAGFTVDLVAEVRRGEEEGNLEAAFERLVGKLD